MSKPDLSPEKSKELLDSIESRFEKLPELASDIEKLKKMNLKPKTKRWNLLVGAKKYVNGQYEEGAILVYKAFGINGYERRFERFKAEILIKLRELKQKHFQEPIEFFKYRQAS